MPARLTPKMTSTLNPQDIISRIRAVLPPGETKAALHEPRFHGNEKRYLDNCIDTGWVSYGGAYVERFEHALAECCGAAHAIAVTSGTVALQVALHAGGVSAGDEVLVPALTFVGTANAVVHAGAVPNFVDSEDSTLGLCTTAVAAHRDSIGERRGDHLYNDSRGRSLSAFLAVPILGHPVDMDPLMAVAERYKLLVIEDATEALGSRYKYRPCGSLAPLSILSFNGNKIATTGGGGAILTSDASLARHIRHITTTAKKPHPWAFNHDAVAWNFRMPNINAALGLAQLEQLATAVAAKRRLWKRYAEAFATLPGVRVFSELADAESNYWLVSLLLDRGREDALEPILAATNDVGLMTRPAWTPMHRLPMYEKNPRAPLPVTEDLVRRIINLPSSPFLSPP